jgi:hypothetical protein
VSNVDALNEERKLIIKEYPELAKEDIINNSSLAK